MEQTNIKVRYEDFSGKTFNNETVAVMVGCKMPKNITNSSFKKADLQGSDFSGCHIDNCDFSFANLDGCNFEKTIFTNCNFFSASMLGVDMEKAKANWTNAFFHEQCPKNGSFTAYKKVGNYIVELLIPKDARRTTEGCTRKCRAEKVKVVCIYDLEKNKIDLPSLKNRDITYKVGKIVKIENYDEERFNNNGGIYFFINFYEAVCY